MHLQVVSKCQGKELVGKTYQPLFNYFKHLKQHSQNGSKASGPFRIVSDKYVTDSDGTGVVHQAPFFGEDDLRVCLAHGKISQLWLNRNIWLLFPISFLYVCQSMHSGISPGEYSPCAY